MADLDLDGIRGDTNVYTVTAVQAPPNQASPLDLTGAFLWFSLKRSIVEATALLRKTSGAGGAGGGWSTPTPSNGISSVTLDPTDTAALSPGPYVYDVQVKEAGGRVTTLSRGTFRLAGDVTEVTS
jgi:hypothetical protein